MIVVAPHLDAAAKGVPFETREDVLAFMVKREHELREELVRQDRKIGRMARLAREMLAVQAGSAGSERS